MSDPVTNVEIEDVLASIRKLVSHGDKAPATAESPAEQAPAPQEDGAVSPIDRLVLTPALRVAENGPETEAETGVQTAAEADEAAAPDQLQEPDEPESDNGDVAEFRIEAPSDPEETDDAEPAASDDTAQDTTLPPVDLAEVEDLDAPLTFPEPQPEPLLSHRVFADAGTEAGADLEDPVESASDEVPNETGRASLMATIAELEAAVGGTGTEAWEPDGSEAEPQVDWDGLGAPPGTAARPADNDAPPKDWPSSEIEAEEEAAAPAPEGQTEPAPEDQAEAEPEVHDWAVAASSEAQNPHVTPLRPTPAQAQAQEQAQAVNTGEAEADDDLTPDLTPDLDEDLSSFMDGAEMIDEDSLRDLVAEIVREELQGALGERITRNVRKLVRREIYRILSSQDFE